MSHDTDTNTAMSTDDKIVYMANQIATFFKSMPHQEAVDGVAKHINDFWDPRMREKFFALMDTGGGGFDMLVREAAAAIRRPAR